MDLTLLLPLVYIFVACYGLKFACDNFENSAGYLGRNLPAGVKGATINAVGSSMPEMFSIVAILFFINDPALFAVGLGITAGSAIFNGCVIPALSILVAKDENGNPVESIALCRKSLMRDLFWVLIAECTLVYLLGFDSLTLAGAVALNLVYIGYAIHLYRDAVVNGENETEEYEFEDMENKGFLGNIVTMNVNGLLRDGREWSGAGATVVLACATVLIAGFSHLLVEGVIGTPALVTATTGWTIPTFFVGLVLGSAASSIPDLILSIKDAKKGNYEDAVANPLASNTFDTTISIALPLVIWMIWQDDYALELVKEEGLTELRISIVAVTLAVGSSLLFKYRAVTKGVAGVLLSIYGIWAAAAVYFIA